MRPFPVSPPRLWGKLIKDDDGNVVSWLPLVDHCTDVACVFEALCQQDSIARALAHAAGRPLNRIDIERLAVFAFIHDLGKCNHGFQAKALPNPRNPAGHVREIVVLLHEPELAARFMQAIDFERVTTWFEQPDTAYHMLVASISHHGKPFSAQPQNVHLWKSLWKPDADIDPMIDIASLMHAAQTAFPKAFTANADPLPATSALQHRFAGLLMLADWLGSDADSFFPFKHGTEARLDFSRRAAARALTAVGLNLDDARSRIAQATSFKDLFPFPPTRLQVELFDPGDSPILIAESETGSGKTEAALGHYFQLFARGDVDSLYFALPTRVAAKELYERVLEFARNAFGNDHPPVLLAVPGYAQVDGVNTAACLPTAAYLWQDDAATRRHERAWSAERPKRFLAAPIAVGTIDQALLSVMQSNHAHLRSVCLDRALLVVDEVHASDTYMRSLLRALLDHHRSVGGRALLLSATLGSDARAELLTPLDSIHSAPSLEQASAQPYPSLTDSDHHMTPLSYDETRGKRVYIEPKPCLAAPEQMLPALLDAIGSGARVLIVLNTVARVNALLRAAESMVPLASALFAVRGVTCPHHGRFARADRLLLDSAVSAQFGKKSPGGPRLLIGSQTLEQSLDIDADWLITDLCPMDILLQRIGRLHRHTRKRPSGFESARCTVLVPEDHTLESFFNAKRQPCGPAGFGNVYPDLRMARLTLERIGEGCEINIPAQNRALVEWATHPENLARFDHEPWLTHRNELLGITMAHGHAARGALMQETEAFGDTAFRAFDEKISTRLGLDDRRVPLSEPVTSPFGQTLHDLAIPGWMAQGVDATDLDSPPISDGRAVTFHYGGKAYRYTRFGLEFADER